MELNEIAEPGPPAERRKRPTWAWLAGGGGLTLIAILTATALELSLRPMSAPASDGALAAPPPDSDLLATFPLPSADPIMPPAPAPAAPEPPPPAAAEAAPPRPLDTTPPQSARVPTRPPPLRPAAPTMPRGKDG